MTYDAGRIRHDGSLMHYSRASNGSAVTSNWRLSATGDTGVVWSPESASAVSYGSNATSVGTANAGGASSDASRADHVHLGVRGISSNGSNTLVGDVNLSAGSGIALGVSGQSISIVNTGSAGGGGSVSYGSNSNEVSYANAAGASSLVSRADHVHLGVTSVSHSSNTFSGPVILTASGALGITVPTPGTLNFSSPAAAGGGGGSTGALILLEQHTASSSATLDFTSTISSTYDDYLFELIGVKNATNTVSLLMRVSTDGGSSYDSGSNYVWSHMFLYPGASGNESGNPDTSIGLGGSVDNSHQGVSGTIKFYDPGSSVYKTLILDTVRWVASGISVPVHDVGAAQYSSNTAVNAVRFLFSSGNISSGTIRAYGIVK